MRGATWLSVAALGLALGLLGGASCKKDAPAGPGEAGEAGKAGAGESGGGAAGGGESAKDYGCQADSECRVSCAVPGDCCGELCECTRAYHEDELDAVRAANERDCPDQPSCPAADCPRPEGELLPVCREGTCATREVPRYWPEPSSAYPCTSDEECVLSCVEANECCAGCTCDAVYHVDQLAKIQAINRARCTDEERAGCPRKKCAAPSVRAVCDGVCKTAPVAAGGE